jgi:AcrR family transcriptional regulator
MYTITRVKGPAAGTVRRSPVQARSRTRMTRVLDVTAALVDERGPEAVTTGLIAQRAGVSIGWLYGFFPNRETIFDAVVARSFDKVAPIAERVHAERVGDDWPTALTAVIRALFDFYRTEPGFRVLWFSRFQSTEMLEVNRANDLAATRDSYERLARHGLRLAQQHQELAMHLVIGIIDKGLDLAFRIDPAGDPAIVRETAAAAIAYLESCARS